MLPDMTDDKQQFYFCGRNYGLDKAHSGSSKMSHAWKLLVLVLLVTPLLL